MSNNNFFSFSTEDVERITEAYSFSGFLTSSELRIAHETDTSMNLSMVLEDGSRGDIQQEQLEEPQAHSSLLEPAEGSSEPAKANEPAKAGEVDPEAVEAKLKKRRNRRHLSRERAKVTKKFSELSTGQDGQGNSGSEASGSGTGGAKSKPVGLEPVERCGRYSPTAQNQPSGSAEPAEKRGRSSPGENTESKRKRQEDIPPSRPSFLEATRRDIVLSITPLDSKGDQIGATPRDKAFIQQTIEQLILRKKPQVNITEFLYQRNQIKVTCLNQKTLEWVKSVVSPLKGPRGNLQGYQCLGPSDRPPLTTYGVWVQKPVPKKAEFIEFLKDANNWLNPSKLVVKADIPKEGGTTFLVGVEPEIKAELEKRHFKLRYGAGRVAHFKGKPKGQPKGKRGNP